MFLTNQHNTISSEECNYTVLKQYSDKITGKKEIK